MQRLKIGANAKKVGRMDLSSIFGPNIRFKLSRLKKATNCPLFPYFLAH